MKTWKVTELNARTAMIAQRFKSSKESFKSFDIFDGKETELQIINLPIEVPLYRMGNGRTMAQQAQILVDEELGEDFFKSGQENQSAQARQHKILSEMATVAKEGNVQSVQDVLAREGQREPLMITLSGIVVNGNRRLAAMRQLYESNVKEHSNFEVVQCAVLPTEISDLELSRIEIRLQMRTETKLDYTWIDEALMAEKSVELEGSEAKVAALMQVSERDVKKMIRSLQEVRIYLQTYLGKGNEFSAVQNKKQLFEDLAKLTSKTSDAAKQDFQRRALWANYDDARSGLGSGRAYGFNWAAENDADLREWVEKLATQIPSTLPAVDGGEPDAVSDDMQFDLEEPVSIYKEKSYLIREFDGEASREETLKKYSRIRDNIKDKKDLTKLAAAPLDAARKALSQLQAVDVAKAKSDGMDELISQLEEIRDYAKTLIKVANRK